MKKSLMICTAALVLRTCVAHAGIDLSWDGCPPHAAAVGDKLFTCDGSGFYQMYANYQPPVTITNFIGIQGQISIQSANGPIQPFWAFESFGCNELSFSPSDARGTTNPTCNIPTQWGASGTSGIEAWQYTRYGPANRALYQFADYRSTAVASIAAGSNQYAFTLNFDETNVPGAGGNDCVGCTDNVVWHLDYIEIFSTTNPKVRVTGPGFRNQCATANGPNPAVCYALTCEVPSYRDADGDGYGDPSVSVTGCSPSGYVSDRTDCDDTRASVHPGALESACDGLDHDCNGLRNDVPSGLVGLWKAEGNANDSVGTNHGTLQNGATFAGGEVGQAFSMDGIDDYVGNLGTAATFSFIQNTGIFTIEAWIKLNDPNALGEQAITANTPTTAERGHYFIWDNSAGARRLTLLLMKGVVGNPVISSSSPDQVITDSNWHHVAAVGNGAGITFYVDGVAFAGSGVMGSKPTGSATRAIDIGRCGNAQCQFGGQIDELALHNRALTASEIEAIFNTGSAGRCGAVVSVSEPRSLSPKLGLGAVSPNPASEGIDFEIQIPLVTTVNARVVDVTGRLVSTILQNREMSAGRHRLKWDGRDASGKRVIPGIYLLRIAAGSGTAVQRIVMLK